MTIPAKTRAPKEETSRSALLNMIYGFRASQMICVAAKLRIADLLVGGPKSTAELARAVGCHEDSLYRLLRALAGTGIFVEEGGRSFRLTPEAELLRSDVPDSLRSNAEVVGEAWTWLPWGSLLRSVMTGQTAFDHVYGKNTWDWFAENPDAGRLFDQCMDETTAGDMTGILAAYDFSGVQTVVDIAGGRGSLLAAILRQDCVVRGVLFNLPQVIESARSVLSPDIVSRMQFVSGNFFRGVPAGGDLYILKNILHDWNDESALVVLAACRRAMSDHARLLIIEYTVGAPNERCAGKGGDIQMMVRNGGRNRTESEFRELLSASGFYLSRAIPTPRGPDLLEALLRN